MTQKSKKHRKSVLLGRSIRSIEIGSSIGALKEHIGAQISAAGKSMHDEGIPPFHILTKKDIEKELSQIEKKFGMTPEEFHKAWREGKVHGHEVMKLGCYYEFYKDEYE
jgi:hypothetical protein